MYGGSVEMDMTNRQRRDAGMAYISDDTIRIAEIFT